MLVLARPVAIDLVIGAHDGPRLAGLDRDLEGEQVAHPQARLVDPCIDDHPPGLLRIQREVLHGRDDPVRLHPGDMRPRQPPREQRILAQIFEVAPVPRVTCQVHAACKQDVEPLGARFGTNHRAAGTGDGGVETRCRGQAGRQRGGDVPLALLDLIGDAERRVALPDQRHTQSRNAVDMACRRDQLLRALAGRHRREQAVRQLDLLVERHPGDDRHCPCPRVATHRGRLSGLRLHDRRAGAHQCSQ